jgi:mannose-6-phosphate isomerase-like protein (cupin superfamily)
LKISKANGEHYKWGSDCDGWHLVKQGDLSVIHERMPAGTAEVRHYHQKARQFFFVLSGVATMIVDSETVHIAAHEGIEVAPGVPHQMRNDSDGEIEFLVISQPATRGDRIHVE